MEGQTEADSIVGVEVGLSQAVFTNVDSQSKGIRITGVIC